MSIIAFMNQKGGVGKTTTAVTIGSILASEHRKKVLLVDLDPQGNLSDHLSIDPNETELSIYNVIIGGAAPETAMRKVHGLDVLPANIDLSDAEVELAGMMMRETRLKKALDPLAANYDYVLLDCPPSLGLLTISGLTFAEQVIVPMQAEYLALRGLSQLVQTIGLVREHLNPGLDVTGVVFCMYDGRTNLSRDVRAEVENHFPGRVYSSVIRKNIRMAEAPSHGLPVNLYDPQCAGVQDYRAVVNELLAREGQHDKNPSRREPLWKGDEARASSEAKISE